jgi:hypothetical protein
MIYENFPSIPLHLVITLQNRKTLFCVFLPFTDIPGLKLTWDFLGVNILPREAPGGEVNNTRPRGQTRTCGMGPWLGHATLAYLGIEPPRSSIFVSRCLAWPKMPIYRPSLDDHEVRRRRNTNHKNRGCSSKDWRRKRCRSLPPDASPPSPIATPSSPPSRGRSPPLDYGFVAVACPISLLCFNV